MKQGFLSRNPSVLWFLAALGFFTLVRHGPVRDGGRRPALHHFVKTLGKTLCLCLVAVAMDVVWGYCGILSLGHFAFFGIGGYAIGMWLMYARTEIIVVRSLEFRRHPAHAGRDHAMPSAARSSASWGPRTFPGSGPFRTRFSCSC